jgi:hypothetical protein
VAQAARGGEVKTVSRSEWDRLVSELIASGKVADEFEAGVTLGMQGVEIAEGK